MTRGAYYSAGLHIAILIFAILGLPSFFDDDEPEPMVLTVEILPISEVSNVPPSQKPLAPKVEKEQPKKEVKPTPPTKAAPPPPEKEKVTVPEDKPKPKDSLKKEPEKPKKPEKPKETKSQEEPKDKPDKDKTDLDAVLNSVRDEAISDDSDKKKVDKPTPVTNIAKSNAPYDPSRPLSISEMDAIRGQFVRCWRVPAGSKDDYTLKVHVTVELRADGSVVTAKVAMGDMGRYSTDQFFQAAADSAIRAVYKCSPLKNLPADKFSTWKDMELTFDPKDLLY